MIHEEKLVNDPQKPVVKLDFPRLFQVLMFTESAISRVPSVLGQNSKFVERIGLVVRVIKFEFVESSSSIGSVSDPIFVRLLVNKILIKAPKIALVAKADVSFAKFLNLFIVH